MLIENYLILNTSNDDSFYINNLVMKTFAQIFFENNAFLINNGLLEKKLDCSVDWIVKKCKNSFEFHSKLFIVNKHGLNNKTIKLIVKCYFVKS
jgi:hypothetical protein